MLILVAVTISMAINGGLFDYAGRAVGDTQNAIDAEQELGSGKIKVEENWYNSIDDYINNKPIEPEPEKTIAIGDFVKYGVSYTDTCNSKDYTTTNGWRLLDYTDNGDGTISNVKLISTGVPANLSYYYYYESAGDWWVEEQNSEDETVPNLTTFKNILGGEDYTFYSGNLADYQALKAAAGLYYNFGDIRFDYSNDLFGMGKYTSITVYNDEKSTKITYDASNDVEASGNDLFRVGRNVERVRLLTLREVVEAVGSDKSDYDSDGPYPKENDKIGLFYLGNLSTVEGMDEYSYVYPNSSTNWLASPYPDEDERFRLLYLSGYGLNTSSSEAKTYGVRPLIEFAEDVKFSVNCVEDETLGNSYWELTPSTFEGDTNETEESQGSVISTTKNYIGCYADINDDGEPDGIIYADLAFSMRGIWNKVVSNDSAQYYEYSAKSDLKSYYIKEKDYEGDFDTKDIIAPISGKTGNDRFYIIALEDIATDEAAWLYWYYNANNKLDRPVAWNYNDFGEGKSNTINMINDWNNNTGSYGTQHTEDFWGVIQNIEGYDIVDSVNDSGKWFVPSKAEWSAFGDYLFSKLGVTEQTYGKRGLKYGYWSSSQKDKNTAWRFDISDGYMSGGACNGSCWVRLGATF